MFSVDPVQAEDMPRCMSLVISSFTDDLPPSLLGEDTPENCEFRAAQHLQGHAEHSAKYPSVAPAIKCTYTSPSGEKTIVGFGEWLFYDRERTEEEYSLDNYILRLEYLPEKERRECLDMIGPILAIRRDLWKEKKYGFLMFLCVDEKYRRMGVATKMVRWGMDRCDELRVPGYLEATGDGQNVYKKLGWELVGGGELPGMVYLPDGVEGPLQD